MSAGKNGLHQSRVARYLLIGLCTGMFISGCALMALGVWTNYGANALVYTLETFSVQLTISYICISMGAAVIFTSLIGGYGAWRRNHSCILLLFFILTVLFLAEAVGTLFVLVYKDQVAMMLHQASKQSLQKLYMGTNVTDPISSVWNTLMNTFKCCGFENSTVDFEDSAFSKSTGLKYPITCCTNSTLPACDGISIVPNLIHPQSCYEKLIGIIRKKSAVMGATAGSICIIELSTMIFTIALFINLWTVCESGEEFSSVVEG